MKIGILASHPIQYHAPLFRALAQLAELEVLFGHRQDASGQASAGYGVAFEWDVDLLAGYTNRFLHNIARTPSVERFFGCDNPELSSIIATGGYDGFVVMGWNLKTYWQALFACQRANIPVFARGDSHLLSPRSRITRLVKRLVYPTLLRQFDGHLFVGERNRQYLAHYKVPESRRFRCAHAIDLERYQSPASLNDSQRIAIRQRFGLPVGRSIAMFAGRLIAWKRPADLVLAVATMPASERPFVVFVGSGPEQARIADLAESLGVEVRMAGFQNQSEMPNWYAIADCLVLPGHETWGLVVNEAMACGTPVVVSSVAGCAPDMVPGSHFGAVYEFADVSALAQAMTLAMSSSHNREARQKRVQHAAEFSPSNSAQGIVEAINVLRLSRGYDASGRARRSSGDRA